MTLRFLACSALALGVGLAALPAAYAAEGGAMMHQGMMKKHKKKDSMMQHGMMKKDQAAPQDDAAPK